MPRWLGRVAGLLLLVGCSAALLPGVAPSGSSIDGAKTAELTIASATPVVKDGAGDAYSVPTLSPAAPAELLNGGAADAESNSVNGLLPTEPSRGDKDAAAPISAATGQEATTASAGPSAQAPVAAADAPCDDTRKFAPLPPRGSPGSQDFFSSFRAPLPLAPLWSPPGPRKVGLQAGHWLTDQVPPELGRLQAGAVGGGKQEWEVNLDVARRAAAMLEASGIQVDVLPTTIPPSYRASVFVAVHADGDPAGQARGFKVARPGFSSVPAVDDQLVDDLNRVYAADTGLPRDDEHISVRMRYYYAFNSRRYCHSVAPGVPQAIIELAYLTSPVDRGFLIGNPDRLARGLASGIQAFLNTLP